jgi:hypothetical protein
MSWKWNQFWERTIPGLILGMIFGLIFGPIGALNWEVELRQGMGRINVPELIVMGSLGLISGLIFGLESVGWLVDLPIRSRWAKHLRIRGSNCR